MTPPNDTPTEQVSRGFLAFVSVLSALLPFLAIVYAAGTFREEVKSIRLGQESLKADVAAVSATVQLFRESQIRYEVKIAQLERDVAELRSQASRDRRER